MKFVRAMKIEMRRRKRVEITYPLIGARNAFTRYTHGLEKYIISDFSRLENVTDFSWARNAYLCTILGLKN